MEKHAIFARIILNKLEQGTVPWRKPWREGLAREWKTGRPYSGLNQYFLDAGEYATFKQVVAAGGRVRQGMKARVVCFYKWHFKVNELGEEIGYPVLRNHAIFEINSQCTGMKSNMSAEDQKTQLIASCEAIRNAFCALPNSPEIRHSTNTRAFYSALEDFIHLPNPDLFDTKEQYYSTLFHEMIHATGHKNRLKRKGVAQGQTFGNELYSKEELIAEMGAGILCNYAQIGHKTVDNMASYVASWLDVLKNDHKLIFVAHSYAEKAVKYILGDLYQPV